MTELTSNTREVPKETEFYWLPHFKECALQRAETKTEASAETECCRSRVPAFIFTCPRKKKKTEKVESEDTVPATLEAEQICLSLGIEDQSQEQRERNKHKENKMEAGP